MTLWRNSTDVATDPTTWSPILQEAVKAQEIGIIPFDLKLDYNYWTYRTYVESILSPLDKNDNISQLIS